MRQAVVQQELNVIIAAIFIVGIWYMMCFYIICICLKKDFNIEFKKITNIGKKIKEFIFTKILKYVLLGIPLFFSVLTFWAAYDSRENIVQSIILIIVGCVFGLPALIIYNFIKEEPSKNKDKEKKSSKKITINIIQIMGIIFILFGIVSLFTYYENINIKNKVERSRNCSKYNFSTR